MIKTYKQITFCENKKRVSLLEKFKLHLDVYLNNLKHHHEGGLSENVQAKEEHKEINKLIDEACSYIDAIPSIVGPRDENNYLTRGLYICQQNLMDRCYFYKSLVNMTERAIAVYSGDNKRAKQRTYNPFFWMILLIDYLFVNLFFKFLNKIFPNKEGIEFSPTGILIQWMLRIVFPILVYIIGNIVIIYLQTWGFIPTP